ncbi:MAG: hypothetical protein ABSG93_12865 [Solirubrobacteraceae bacterium]
MRGILPRVCLSSQQEPHWLWDSCVVSVIGFLHTAESHVETFGALVEDVDATRGHVHAVRPDLLDQARLHGTDDQSLSDQLSAAISDLTDREASVVICTCSTLGGVAERCAAGGGVNVLRVDRPMAEIAVRSGSQIGVVAALESTLAPTRALLEEVASQAGREIALVDAPCFGVWSLFERGDIAGYFRGVAEAADRLDPTIEVVVLAQASMAPAAPLIQSGRMVLSSPRSAVQAAVRLVAART